MRTNKRTPPPQQSDRTRITVLGVFEGNGCRPSHQGFGLRAGDEPMYTLNTTEVHGVIVKRGVKRD